MKPMASARKSSRSNDASIRSGRFVLCVCNKDYPASLELRKLYPFIADTAARRHDLVRIIDESGEDYVYSAGYFVCPAIAPKRAAGDCG